MLANVTRRVELVRRLTETHPHWNCLWICDTGKRAKQNECVELERRLEVLRRVELVRRVEIQRRVD